MTNGMEESSDARFDDIVESASEIQRAELKRKIEHLPLTIAITLLQNDETGLKIFFEERELSFNVPFEGSFGSKIIEVPPEFFELLVAAAQRGMETALKVSSEFPDQVNMAGSATFDEDNPWLAIITLTLSDSPAES